MAVDLLLREGKINKMRMRNRIITGPMEKGMANRDGSLTPRYIDYLVERAKGGASLIQVESTYVDTRGMVSCFRWDATVITSFRPWREWRRRCTPREQTSAWNCIWAAGKLRPTWRNGNRLPLP